MEIFLLMKGSSLSVSPAALSWVSLSKLMDVAFSLSPSDIWLDVCKLRPPYSLSDTTGWEGDPGLGHTHTNTNREEDWSRSRCSRSCIVEIRSISHSKDIDLWRQRRRRLTTNKYFSKTFELGKGNLIHPQSRDAVMFAGRFTPIIQFIHSRPIHPSIHPLARQHQPFRRFNCTFSFGSLHFPPILSSELLVRQSINNWFEKAINISALLWARSSNIKTVCFIIGFYYRNSCRFRPESS